MSGAAGQAEATGVTPAAEQAASTYAITAVTFFEGMGSGHWLTVAARSCLNRPYFLRTGQNMFELA